MIAVQSNPTCLKKHLTKKKKKEDTNQNFKKQKNCCTYTCVEVPYDKKQRKNWYNIIGLNFQNSFPIAFGLLSMSQKQDILKFLQKGSKIYMQEKSLNQIQMQSQHRFHCLCLNIIYISSVNDKITPKSIKSNPNKTIA